MAKSLQKQAARIAFVMYLGLLIGYLNKGVLFVKFLTLEQLGLYNLIVAVGLLFAQLANIGASSIFNKFMPYFNNKEKKDFGILAFAFWVNALGLAIFTVIFILLKPLVVYFYAQNSPLFVEYYFLLFPIGIGFAIYTLFDSFLRSIHKNDISVIVFELIMRLFATFFIVLFLFKLIDFQTFIWFGAFSFLMPASILIVYVSYLGRLNLAPNHIIIKKKFKKILMNFGLFTYLGMASGTLITTLDQLMLSKYQDLKVTAIFSTIIFLLSALQLPYKSLIRLSYVQIAEFWKSKNMVRMQSFYRNMSSVNLIIILWFFIVIWVLRAEVFGLLPQSFSGAQYIFLPLMIGKIFDSYSGVNSVILLSSKKYRLEIYLIIGTLVLIFCLNLLLIPRYGGIGAAIATGLSICLVTIARTYSIFYFYKIHYFRKSQLIVALLASLNLVCFEFLPKPTNDFFAIAIYGTLLTMLFLGPIYLLKIEPEFNKFANLFLVKLKLVKAQ